MEPAASDSYGALLRELGELAGAAAALPPAAVAERLERLAAGIRAAAGAAGSCPPADAEAVDSALEGEEGEGEGPSCTVGITSASPSSRRVTKKQRKEKPVRELDFSRYRRRYVALEVMYIGVQYSGFARQETSDNTIEAHLFNAMRKTKLIPEGVDVAELKYSRCGRTDRGVSALGQVVAIVLRSSGKSEETCDLPEDQEMDYARVMNRALPDEIRVLGWTTAPEDFNARFCALYRQYKYFIVQQPRSSSTAVAAPGSTGGTAAGGGTGTLDIESMRQAAKHFEGQHDFRNFCKPDVASVRSFVRKIHTFDIHPVGLTDTTRGVQVYALNIRGTAFLWHQVRCMANVLLMVGRGQESPDVVRQLLDLDATPTKPQYHMATEEPLLLYACAFEDLRFRRTERAVEFTTAALNASLERHMVSAAMLSVILSRLDSDEKVSVPGEQGGQVLPYHVKLLKRQREPSVEDKAKKLGIEWPPQAQAEEEEDEAME